MSLKDKVIFVPEPDDDIDQYAERTIDVIKLEDVDKAVAELKKRIDGEVLSCYNNRVTFKKIVDEVFLK